MPAVARHRVPIIDAAVALFRRQGYARTGVAEIADESGAPRGSLYHYFPDGKSSIAAAAIEEASDRVAATLQQLAGQTRTTRELVNAYAKLLGGWMRDSGFRDGCPITSVLLTLAPGDRAVTAAGRRSYAARNRVLQDKLQADGHSADRARQLSSLCTSALQGALIQARVERSVTAIEATAAELAQMLALLQSAGARAGQPSKA